MSERTHYTDVKGREFYYHQGGRIYLDGGMDLGIKVRFTSTRPPRDAIPREWLRTRLDGRSEIEAHNLHQQWMGRPADEDDGGTVETRARWTAKWEEFTSEMEPGDEIWHFASPEVSWRQVCGRAGFAPVRKGEWRLDSVTRSAVVTCR